MMSYEGIVDRVLKRLKGAGKTETYKVITIVPLERLVSYCKVGYTVLYTFMKEEVMSLNIGSITIDAKMVGFLVRRESL